MKNHWEFNSNITLDSVGNGSATAVSGCYLTIDRCGRINSALALNGGYLTIPPGVYFAGDFTVTVWVKGTSSVGNNARIFDFAIGAGSDNIILTVTSGTDRRPFISVRNGGTEKLINSNTILSSTQWTFIAATLSGTTLSLYMDGLLVASDTSSPNPRSITRTTNYIGKSNWNDGYSSSYVDELKFYNKALTVAEILQEMNSETCSISKL